MSPEDLQNLNNFLLALKFSKHPTATCGPATLSSNVLSTQWLLGVTLLKITQQEPLPNGKIEPIIEEYHIPSRTGTQQRTQARFSHPVTRVERSPLRPSAIHA